MGSSMQPLCFCLKTLFDCLLATMMASLIFLVNTFFDIVIFIVFMKNSMINKCHDEWH